MLWYKYGGEFLAHPARVSILSSMMGFWVFCAVRQIEKIAGTMDCE